MVAAKTKKGGSEGSSTFGSTIENQKVKGKIEKNQKVVQHTNRDLRSTHVEKDKDSSSQRSLEETFQNILKQTKKGIFHSPMQGGSKSTGK